MYFNFNALYPDIPKTPKLVFYFPVCYYGLGDGYCPNIKITSPFSAVTGKVRDAYTRDLRIAAIILKPKELVEFEESNKK